jgi:two-component system, cell cycle sensor histidine kinase and response regulator CckA
LSTRETVQALKLKLKAAHQRIAELERPAPDNGVLAGRTPELLSMLETVKAFVLFSDEQGRPVFYNQAYARIMKELLGIDMKPGLKPHMLLESAEQREVWEQCHRRALSGETFGFEYEHRKSEDEQYWFKVNYSPIRHGDRVVGFCEITHDVTAAKLLEEAQRETESKYARLFDKMLDGFAYHRMVFDDSGLPIDYVFLEANAAFENLTGLSSSDLIGSRVTEVLPGIELDPTNWIGRYGQVAAGQGEQRFESYSPTLGRWYSVYAFSPKRDHFAVLFSDITDSKEAGQERERLVLAIEQSAESVVITDTSAQIQYVNPAFERVTGYPRSEAIGANVRFLKSGEHTDAFYKQMWKTLTAGETWEGDLTNRRKDGSLFLEHATISPVRDSTGEIASYVAVKRDITQLRRSEAALRESEGRFFQISNHIDEVFWLGDVRDREHHDLLYLSPAFESMWQQSIADVLADPSLWRACVHPEDAQMVSEAFERLLQHNRDYMVHYRIVRPDGSVRSIEESGWLIHNEGGGPIQVAGTARDVTARVELQQEAKALEEQFRQAQKMESIGLLAGGVAHDFNNLLTVINSYAAMGRADLREDDPLRDDLGEIEAAGKRAAALTRQLLAISRKQVLNQTILDIDQVVQGVESLLRRTIGAHISLRVICAGELGPVLADKGQLEQVLMNLVVNARDAMSGGGILTIQTARVDTIVRTAAPAEPKTGPTVTISVTDTGVGIPLEAQTRIFEPFFTTKDIGRGTGLGLSTVHGIVAQSGGRITVDSTVGEGTVFRVYLPVMENPAAPPISAPAPEARRPAGHHGTERIIVVEDERGVRNLVVRILQRAGYDVTAFSTAVEALDEFERLDGQVDLCLSDLVMPGMGGKELAERLTDRWPAVPLLFMSGYSPEALASRVHVRPDVQLFSKPFTPGELRAIVRQTLDRDRE